jgi:hypothetical protein
MYPYLFSSKTPGATAEKAPDRYPMACPQNPNRAPGDGLGLKRAPGILVVLTRRPEEVQKKR